MTTIEQIIRRADARGVTLNERQARGLLHLGGTDSVDDALAVLDQMIAAHLRRLSRAAR